ncbi:MAG: peptidylprolyl isomerase [Pseudomonadota bacterium]
MKRFLKDPLVFFASAASAVFLFWAGLGADTGREREIVVSQTTQSSLVAKWQRDFDRLPTQAEFTGLVQRWLMDEIAIREAMALQLDRDDPIIRRRLIQKLDYFLDAQAFGETTEQELRAYYLENSSNYLRPARFTFSHYFFSQERRDDPSKDALDALAEVSNGKEIAGDSFIQANTYYDSTARQIREVFGEEFTDALSAAGEALSSQPASGPKWVGPFASPFGQHVVHLRSFTAETDESFEQAYDQVAADFEVERRRTAKNQVFASLLESYAVVLE